MITLACLVACDEQAKGTSSKTDSAAAPVASSSASSDPSSAKEDKTASKEKEAVASDPSSAPATPASAASAAPIADPSRLELSGKVIQGGLMVANVEPGTKKLTFPGHRVVISPEGQFLIGFYRNAPPKEKLTITFPDGAVREKLFEVEQRTFGEDKIDGLPEKFVKLPPEENRKLAAANARIAKVRRGYSKKPFYEEGFEWPLKGKVTSTYGVKRILNGTDGGLHWGVDIAVPVGAKVKAPCSGIITFVEKDVPLAGHTLVIDHGHGLTSTLIHLKDFFVKVGDEVKKGDLVATVGMTGRTTGPHLDWRMNLFETYRLDPQLLVPPMP